MNNRKEENEEITIDLGKLFKYYIKHIWSFILAAVAVAVASLVFTALLITPQYKAGVTFYVNNANSMQQIESISSSSLATSMKLVQTYVNIIKSNTVLNDVIDAGNLDCSPEYLRGIMTAEQVEETEMFTVSVSHPNAEMAAHIANSIAEVAPESIAGIVEGSSTKIIDYAETPQHPYSPSYKKNIVLGAMLGIIIVGIVQTLRYIFDMRLNDEEDIGAYFSAPVLGTIPSFEMSSGKKSVAKLDRRV